MIWVNYNEYDINDNDEAERRCTCMYCTALIRVWKVFPQGEETRYLYQEDHSDGDE